VIRSSESDQLEILISRYAAGDDTLTAEERLLVERELDRGAEANELLAGEHRLTELLRTADPVPPINYELLAARISASIPQIPEKSAEAAVITRPMTALRSFWSRPRIALAASVLIAATIAVPLLVNDRETTRPTQVVGVEAPAGGEGSSSIAVTTIRAVDRGASLAKSQPSGGAANVTVGPSPSLTGRPVGSQYGLGSTTNPQQPSRVVITPESDNGTSDGPLWPR
jgi:hypothetical protein